MEMIEASLEHVAVGCNAASNALSVPVQGSSSATGCDKYSAAFAAHNVVCVLRSANDKDPNGPPLTISETLKHQEAAVTDTTRLTSVRLQLDAQSEPQVLAGDSEGRVFLWKRAEKGAWKAEKLSDERYKLPPVAVAAAAIAETKRRRLYVAAFSDGTLVVFAEANDGGEVILMSRLELGVKSIIMEAVEVTVVKNQDVEGEENVLVAAGGVDTKVHLFEVAGGEDNLSPLLKLEGHRGWIRSLAFQQVEREEGADVVMLASASQDQRIRLWKIAARSKIDAANSGEVKDGYLAVGEQTTYIVSFDALLLGHEDWVTSVQWMQLPSDSADACEPALLSSSMDNTLIVWTKPTDARSSWSPSLRVGEMGGNGLLSAGVLPARDNRLNLVSLNFGGQLERWEQQPAPSKLFQPAISVSGHCAEVTDLSWSPRGDYLVSVSLDQTARVLTPSKLSKSKPGSTTGWYEISRAQVHGYDINCACFVLGKHPTNDRFVSGADEKILRAFEAPDEVSQLVGQLNPSNEGGKNNAESQVRTVQHAYLPELSLTNKSAEETAPSAALEKNNGYANLKDSVSLPVGDRLGRKTLWPEQRKLYGHGNELLCVTSSHSGDLIASTCKSREERYAAVRLWNTSDWSEAQDPLEGHKSSVVQLAFSPNDHFLLSVSRDRQFCLYQRQQRSEGKFALVEHVKAHRRIIWSCSWSPDSSMFALGSRDQSFSLWGQKGGKWDRACASIAVDAAVTAVAFSPSGRNLHEAIARPVDVLAVGLETGAIRFFAVSKSSENDAEVKCMQVGGVAWGLSPSAAILRLAWGPATNEDEYTLAVASSDNSVRIFSIKL